MRVRKRTHIARRLRRDATEAEKRLWWALRELPVTHRFRRQHPIGQRVVDFACPGCKLVIELDGGQHATRQMEDLKRTVELERHGYRVVRFWNNDVTDNLEVVIEMILRELKAIP
jgi:very-short-patch-repair endonuclease